MKREPDQDYPPDQQPAGKKIKIKGSPLLKDWDQVEVTTKKVEGTTVKTTKSNDQDRSEVKHPFGQPGKTTLTKMIVGWKEALNQNTKKPEHTIDFPVL